VLRALPPVLLHQQQLQAAHLPRLFHQKDRVLMVQGWTLNQTLRLLLVAEGLRHYFVWCSAPWYRLHQRLPYQQQQQQSVLHALLLVLLHQRLPPAAVQPHHHLRLVLSQLKHHLHLLLLLLLQNYQLLLPRPQLLCRVLRRLRCGQLLLLLPKHTLLLLLLPLRLLLLLLLLVLGW
jgi:hypothetical protein